MTVKPGGSYKARAVLYLLGALLACSRSESKLLWWCGIGIGMFLLVMGILDFIAHGRTFLFTPNGITVRFLRYERAYGWDELELKRYGYYEELPGFFDGHKGGAEFCFKPLRRPQKILSLVCCRYIHPFAYIFIYFQPQKDMSNTVWYDPCYEVKEGDFRAMLSRWGVKMEDERW